MNMWNCILYASFIDTVGPMHIIYHVLIGANNYTRIHGLMSASLNFRRAQLDYAIRFQSDGNQGSAIRARTFRREVT
jgi:hypothetical protein